MTEQPLISLFNEIQDSIDSLNRRIDELNYNVNLAIGYIRKINNHINPSKSEIEHYPDETYLDKLEEEEHRQVLCTYPTEFEKNSSTINEDLMTLRK